MGSSIVSGTLKRAVFLDRDGVLNKPIIRGGKPYPPSDVEETVLLPDAESSLARLKRLGFLLVVVTNQPDVRRQTTPREVIERIHDFLVSKLPLDDFFICYHDDQDRCNCRKPLPGLLFEAAAKYNIDIRASYLVGDRWRDIEAGAAAGCRTALIDYHYNEQSARTNPDVAVSSLTEAVDWIMEQELKGN